MAKLCSFCWKSTFSKRFLGYYSTDFVHIYRAYVKKYYLVSQEAFFWHMAGVWNFLKISTPFFIRFFKIKEHNYFWFFFFCISPVNLNKIVGVVREISWLPQKALLKINFQQKWHIRCTNKFWGIDKKWVTKKTLKTYLYT